jgi:CheY-like chemotaxis protein
MARILVLSDDADTRTQILSGLDREHDVRTFGSNHLGGLRGTEPDLVIVESNLLFSPVLAAAGLVRRAGDRGAGLAVSTQAPSVLVLVDPGQEDRIIPAFEAGADDYLLRPVEGIELRSKVDRVLVHRLGLLPSDVSDPIAISDDGRLMTMDDEELTHANVGRYEVEGILGRGGYGVVYRARDLALGREVALKVLPKGLHDNSEAVTRFFRESSSIARLNHPNIVRFYELGSFQGRYYFTMELVRGRTLKEIADRESPLPVARAVHYVTGIAQALVALDSIGLVHRDVKPENVIVTPDDQVKLIDFGLVRIRDTAAITSMDDVLGTPYFMAPEYIKAPGTPDIRYDLYALGITFFHLLTGEYPFDGKNAAHVMEKHLRCKPPSLAAYQVGIPRLVEKVVELLLQKDPDQRLQTPHEVLYLLEPL